MSVALSIIFINLFFQDDVLIDEFSGSKSVGCGTDLPVPNDKIH